MGLERAAQQEPPAPKQKGLQIMSASSITRRDLVKAGGFVAAGAAGASAFGASSAQAMVNSTIHELPSFFYTPDPVADSDIVATHEYDIVVVGAGQAGNGAAVSALKNGASVCVVEKMPQANTQGLEGAAVDLANSDDAAVKYLVSRHIEQNDFRPVREIVDTWAYRSAEAFECLREATSDGENPLVYDDGMAWDLEYPGTDMKAHVIYLIPSSGNYIAAGPAVADAIAAKGADYYYEMPASQLVKDADGRVTGVVCTNADGEYELFTANKGVILAAGDYQNDPEMVGYFLPDVMNGLCRQIGKTGDGIKMAMWAGGVIEPVGHTKMCHGYGNGPLGDEPFLRVNMKGERFSNEDMDLWLVQTLFRLDEATDGYCQIFDSNYEEQIKSWDGGSTNGGWAEYDTASMNAYVVDDPEYAGRGKVYRADSIEELAELLGISDTAALASTVQRYNELVAAGADTDFGKPVKYLQPIDTPPFYGIYRTQNLTAITSGIMTDGAQHVLDANAQPIPGLYAAGNNAGGFYGAVDYPLYDVEGISIGRSITGGYVAAENICAGI